jgi:hypothetical protein
MQKIDLKTDLKALYAPSRKEAQLIDVPEMQFLIIDGQIEPGQAPGDSPDFQACVQALYSAAYTLKFSFKMRKEDPIDYPVMALEGLWWIHSGEFDINRKDNWAFTLMIMQPEVVTPADFNAALPEVRRKKGDLPALNRLRLERFCEGPCVQIMHVGPYATEPATIEKMEAFAAANQLKMAGRHHEIYLGNPLTGNQEKMKTILRHAVQPLAAA